jgi:hypothetical protein
MRTIGKNDIFHFTQDGARRPAPTDPGASAIPGAPAGPAGPANPGKALRAILLSALILALSSGFFAPSESLAASEPVRLNYRGKGVDAGTEFTLKFRNLKKTETKKEKYKTPDGKTKYKKVKTYPKITWTSSDPAVATVKDGKVTAVHYGQAIISAQFRRKADKKIRTYTCNVNVRKPNYIVDPLTAPLPASGYEYAPAYNDYTRNYYTLRSYVEDIEKRGGGSLTLAPGVYNVTNVVYIPSDTTIYLSDGVVIQNASETYTSRLNAAKTVFHFCAPSTVRDGLTYSGYNGVHDSAIIGYGNAIIDMEGVPDRYGVVMAHATNITVQGVAFTNINNGHGIEVNASSNVNIANCSFTGDISATSPEDEGVNIDSADPLTGGLNAPYSSYDCTACSDVTVQGCVFADLPRAIGSHKYSYGRPHIRINVIGNAIRNARSDAIGAMYWKDSLIQNNNIDGVTPDKHGVSGGGAINLTVRGNVFANMSRVAEFFVWEESYYPMIQPEMSDAALSGILYNNTFINVTNVNIRMEPDYNTDEFYFPPGSQPN